MRKRAFQFRLILFVSYRWCVVVVVSLLWTQPWDARNDSHLWLYDSMSVRCIHIHIFRCLVILASVCPLSSPSLTQRNFDFSTESWISCFIKIGKFSSVQSKGKFDSALHGTEFRIEFDGNAKNCLDISNTRVWDVSSRVFELFMEWC